MNLTRFDPFRDLMHLQTRINQALSDSPNRWASEDAFGAWAPPVDIFESGDDLLIRAELPGLRREDIDVRVEENTLVLRGERQVDNEINDAKTYRQERVFGAFSRRFALPTSVDPTRITARYVDGLLEVRLPKADEAKPRKIQIDVG